MTALPMTFPAFLPADSNIRWTEQSGLSSLWQQSTWPPPHVRDQISWQFRPSNTNNYHMKTCIFRHGRLFYPNPDTWESKPERTAWKQIDCRDTNKSYTTLFRWIVDTNYSNWFDQNISEPGEQVTKWIG